MNGSRYATARFIARALLTTCGRNIFPAPKRSPTTFIPSISGPSITSSGRSYSQARLLGVLLDEVDDAVHERVLEPLLHRCVTPAEIALAHRSLAAHGLCVLDETFGRIGSPVEDDVLDALEQVGRDVAVEHELAGIDDAHVEAGGDRVVEERRVHRFAHCVVAAERERQVRDAAARLRARTALLQERQASMYAFAKPLCSSMPVATASTFMSKMMSSGGKPTTSTSSR